MQTRECKYQGKRLFYRCGGSGPLVVLLHGFGEDGTVWKGQYDLFPEHTLLVPDLPGSGRSEAIGDMSMEGLAEAVLAMVESEVIGPGLPPAPSQGGREVIEYDRNIDNDSDLVEEGEQEYLTADTVYYQALKVFVKEHRAQPTEAENLLWQALRNRQLAGYKFRRQHVVGKYIADFICISMSLIIEVDGLIHKLPQNQESDAERTFWLNQHGFTVLRFTNEEVMSDTGKVLGTILQHLESLPTISRIAKSAIISGSDPPSLGGGRGEAPSPDPFILIGHSMGGYITLAFAEKYPGLLRALGLFHSTAFADSEEKKETRRKGIRFLEEHGAEEFLKTTIPNLYAPSSREQHPEWIENHLASVHNFSAVNLVTYYRAMIQRPDRTAVIKEATIPVLFVMGRHDTAVPLQDGLKQCHLPQLSYIHILENAGHMGMIEESERTGQLLSQFVFTQEKIAYT